MKNFKRMENTTCNVMRIFSVNEEYTGCFVKVQQTTPYHIDLFFILVFRLHMSKKKFENHHRRSICKKENIVVEN